MPNKRRRETRMRPGNEQATFSRKLPEILPAAISAEIIPLRRQSTRPQ
jgi:hypothetical protein